MDFYIHAKSRVTKATVHIRSQQQIKQGKPFPYPPCRGAALAAILLSAPRNRVREALPPARRANGHISSPPHVHKRHPPTSGCLLSHLSSLISPYTLLKLQRCLLLALLFHPAVRGGGSNKMADHEPARSRIFLEIPLNTPGNDVAVLLF